jgi:hypothetical protein
LKEICVTGLKAAEPGILELLFSPEPRKGLQLIPKHVFAAQRGRSMVEKRPVSVEYTCFNALQARLIH